MNIFNIFTLPPFASSLLFILLGIFVLSKNVNSKTNQAFFALCWATFWWQFSWFVLFNLQDPDLAEIVIRSGYFGIILLPVCLFYFILSMVKNKSRFDIILLKFSVAISLFFEISLLSSDLLIAGHFKYFWGFYPKAGSLHPLFLLFTAFILGRILFLLVRGVLNNAKNFNIKKTLVFYILYSQILYYFASIDFLTNYGIEVYPVGFLFISASMLVVGHAIITKRFLGIKVVLKKSGVYFFSFWTLLLLIFFLKTKIANLGLEHYFLVDLLLLIFFILSFKYIKNFYYFLANKYFFYSLYKPNEVIASVSDHLMKTLDPKKIYSYIFKRFSEIFMINKFIILKYDRKKGKYVVVYSRAYSSGKKEFDKDKYLQEAYFEKNKPVSRDELQLCESRGDESICGLISKNIDTVIPLSTKNKVVGLMMLGPKASEDVYSLTDIKTIKIIAAQLAAAMESRELYKNIYSLNRNLSNKVKEQTAEIREKALELKKKNNELKKLLRMKSDFLRLVNHQLNTPISVIKNSVFMIRKNNFTQEKGLLYIEEGVKRMEEITRDFWKAFSFEGEKVKVNSEKIDIVDMANGLLGQIRDMPEVDKKGLKIKIKDGKDIPKVYCDPKETAQALWNLLNNAVSYTEKGGVEVSFKKEGRFVKIYIKDTGCGIDKGDFNKIFDKFERGDRASEIRPAGSGLGLYIAKKVITACGGELKLESSSPGKGSVFSFSLPISEK